MTTTFTEPRHGRPAWWAILALIGLLGGCAVGDAVVGNAIRASNQADSALLRSRGKTLLAQHLQMIEELQAKGDPLGDYLWVVANANGWVDNPELDPIKLLDMYLSAAAKGSNDGLVAAGLMLFRGSATPNATGRNQPLQNANMNMRKGLELIEQGTRDRCWYWEPVIQTITSENCLRPNVAADKVWPKFRDGFLWPKDEALMNYWKAKSERCEQDPAYQRASAHCS